MSGKFIATPLAAALALIGCDMGEDEQGPVSARQTKNVGSLSDGAPAPALDLPTPAPAMGSPVGGAEGVNVGEPDLTPPALTSEAAKGEKGARNLLLSWARAIELRAFDQAWNLFGATGKERWSRAEFARIFAGLEDITVAVPTGAMEGAAGSLYYTSRATITASDVDGRPIRIEGSVVVRRVNDVPGSTAEQRRWHIESADLAVTH